MNDKATTKPRLTLVRADEARPAAPIADGDIEAGLARGDRDVLQVVYLQHHAAVRTFARRLLGDPAAAEDVVHEVFVALPRAIRSWRRAGTLLSFLLALAVNTGRHHIRASARRRAVQVRFAREPVAAWAPTPERALEREQLAAELLRALDRLPTEQRIAFVLAEVEERSAAEGAVIMGVREGTFRARVFLARRKLRALLGEPPLPPGEEEPS